MNRKFLDATATLVGSTIGAGVLGIPYVVAKAGMIIGLLHIIIIGAAVITVNLFLGEITLRSKGSHQLTGYAEKYLGKKGKRIMTATMIAGIYGALLAYIIGTGASINALLPWLPATAGSLLFFAITGTIVYLGLTAVEKSELLLASLTVSIVMIIILAATISGKFSPDNLTEVNIENLFLPYGVVLFAFLGAVAIPEMKEELGRNTRLLRKAIIAGGILPLALYALFAIAVVGISGNNTGHVATLNLGELGPMVAILANIFAVLAMSTSFIALGLALKEMYAYDYGLNKKLAWALACVIPMAAFIFGLKGFIQILGMAGALAGGIEGLMILAIYRKAVLKKPERKPEYKMNAPRILTGLLAGIFIFGIFYAITFMLRP